MLGGAIAAREDRLLSLSTGDAAAAGQIADSGARLRLRFAAAFAALLCVGGRAVRRRWSARAGTPLAYGIPIWVVQVVLPLGFAAIALRLVLACFGQGGGAGLVAAGIAVRGTALFLRSPLAGSEMVVPGVGGAAGRDGARRAGVRDAGRRGPDPVLGSGGPIASIPLDHYRLVTNPSLPTIPLFTLAGYFLAEGGASKRLVRVFQALFGPFRGGPAIVDGAGLRVLHRRSPAASGVTILALGGLLMPVLLAARYPERSALWAC